MILLREIQIKDLEDVERLAQIPGFINLPSDRELLREKFQKSISSFRDELSDKMEGKYLFAAEDLTSQKVLGTSMIAAQHGTIDSPHFYFEVGSEKKFSETINTGFIHGTLKLGYETNGPSEIGGLVLDSQFRNSAQRIGRQISFVRFLFLGLNRNRFKKKVIAELLPPLNKRGQSPLWEAIGRRFTNMDYWEADQLCQKNKEFIFSLFPSEKVYTTFLPAEARNAIGRVNKETEPVLHMLKKIGFKYMNQVDPFDGGPHLWANVDEIIPVRNICQGEFDPNLAQDSQAHVQSGILAPLKQKPGQFRAMSVSVFIKDRKIKVVPNSQLGSTVELVQECLDIKSHDAVAFMPYY